LSKDGKFSLFKAQPDKLILMKILVQRLNNTYGNKYYIGFTAVVCRRNTFLAYISLQSENPKLALQNLFFISIDKKKL